MPAQTSRNIPVPDSTVHFGTIGRLVHDQVLISGFRVACLVGLVLQMFAALALAFFRGVGPLRDPDIWWHIVMGHRFLDGTSILHPGPVSFLGTEDWRPRDWSTQMLIGLFDDWFGLPGVAWLYTLGLVAFVIVLYVGCRRFAGFAASAFVLPLGFVASQTSLTSRPQLVSFILLVVTLVAMLSAAADGKPRWWLAPMTALWACMHGLWVLSPAIQAIVIAGMFLDRTLTRSALAKFCGIVVASLALVAVTPNGLPQLQRPFGYVSDHARFVQEYQTPTLSETPFVATLLILAGVLVVWATRRRFNWLELGLFLVAVVSAFYMRRTLTLGAVIATLLLVRALEPVFASLRLEISKKMERLLVAGGCLVCLGAAAMTVPHTADEPSSLFPVAFDTAVAALPDEAVLLNELGDGGYLLWKHPGLKTTIDGLSDQYLSEDFVARLGAGAMEEGWEQVVAETGATHALLMRDYAFSDALEERGWTPIAYDDYRVLLVAPSS